MTVMTIRSEKARMQWRETIDAAYVDKTDVIIERHGKPVVTLVEHKKWQQILNRLAALEFAARAAELAPGPGLSDARHARQARDSLREAGAGWRLRIAH